MEYIAYMHKDKGSDYGVSFPDFPGCITAGSTLEEAKDMAIEALNFHVEGMMEDGESVPEPSKLDDLLNDEAFEDAVCFLVSVRARNRKVRINISIAEDQLATIDEGAKASGLNRSDFMAISAVDRAYDVDNRMGHRQKPRSRSTAAEKVRQRGMVASDTSL